MIEKLSRIFVPKYLIFTMTSDISWIDILASQQKDFIARAKLDPANLLTCDRRGFHSELISIASEEMPKLRKFCWEMVKKFSRQGKPEEVFINNLKGKLGEMALKRLISNDVTSIDYIPMIGGDGKVDFKLIDYENLGMQVKVRSGDICETRWSISSDEIKLNQIVVCFLIREEVSEAESDYHIISAGFIPTCLINPNLPSLMLSINDLYYSGGLKGYLNILKYQELKRYRERVSMLLEQEASLENKLYELWSVIIIHVNPPGTRTLFRYQGRLLELDLVGGVARVGITSQRLFKMATMRISNLTGAFEQVFERKIRVSLEIVAIVE